MKNSFAKISMLMLVCLSMWIGVAKAADRPPEPEPSAIPSTTPPDTYYVERHAPGASDSNPGTFLQPWLTIQHAADMARPGDTIIVVNDTYPERVHITNSGTASDPIIFKTDGHVITQGFTIEADFNHVIGFEITDTAAMDGDQFQKDCAGVYVEGSGNQVLENDIHETTCVGIRVYAYRDYPEQTRDNVIRGNKVHRAAIAGIVIFGMDNLIENNEITGTIQQPSKWTNPPSRLDADGIRFRGEGHTFRGNSIHDIRFDDPDNYQGDPAMVPHIDCFQTWATSTNILFERNFCEINAPNGERFHYIIATSPSTDSSGNPLDTKIKGLTIRNNIFRSNSNGFGAIVLQGMADWRNWYYAQGEYIEDITIVHNTFVRTNGLGDHAIWMRYVKNAVVQNNIFYDHNNNSENSYIYCGDSTYSAITCDDMDPAGDGNRRTINLLAGWNMVHDTSVTPVDATYPEDFWLVDPRFVDFPAGDYHLRSDSPAINAGTVVGGQNWVDPVRDDFDGNARPLLGQYDIGAFEALDKATPTPGITGTPTFTPTAMPSITPLPIFTDTATPKSVAITPSITPSPTFTATATPTFATTTPTATHTYGTSDPFFEDVSEDFWAYSYIKALYEDGYLSGVSTDPLLFGTGRGLTRGEGTVFVVRGVEGAEFHPPMPTASPFADVPLGHWAVEWVDWLKRLGFTEGCGVNDKGEAIFCVDFDHTRAEAAVYFVRMVEGIDFVPPAPDQNRPDQYDDVLADNSVWYNKWVYWAKDKGIVGKCEAPEELRDNLFRPNDTILREEAACMMYNAIYVAELGTPTPTPTPTIDPSVTPIHDD